MPREIVSVEKISNPEARRIIEEKLGEETAGLLVKRALDYLNQSTKCSEDTAAEIRKELVELGFSEGGAIVLVNIVPQELVELRSLLPDPDQKLSEEVLRKALELLERCG